MNIAWKVSAMNSAHVMYIGADSGLLTWVLTLDTNSKMYFNRLGRGAAFGWQRVPKELRTLEEMKAYLETMYRMGEL